MDSWQFITSNMDEVLWVEGRKHKHKFILRIIRNNRIIGSNLDDSFLKVALVLGEIFLKISI